MLFCWKNGQTKELQKRKEEVFSFVQNNALHSIIEDVDMQAKPDPFIIVQQAVLPRVYFITTNDGNQCIVFLF